MVRLTLGALAVFVAVCGVSSFVLLGVAIGTDYWYLIDVSQRQNNSNLSLSSHSGLWRTCNSQQLCQPFVNPFEGGQNLTDSYRQLLNMHGTFMVLLPLSMIIMVVGGLMGFIGLLARAYLLLLMTGVLLLLGGKHPLPYTLCLIHYTLRPKPYPYALHPIPYALHLIPYALNLIPYALHLITYALHLIPYALHLIPYALHLIRYALRPTP
ncbi:transmembrane protein 114-like [Salmo salar]|uniref:Transmembrane protein 114-like n=1 Tax=Salmo salar TaxID=8030 RepID=A0ABM3ELX2_SALSA|nr:transmembrane protein 114-like [Salmo salar]